jgi:hypothetical protein
VHGETQGRLEQLVLGKAGAQAQHHAGHVPRDLARQLQTAAVDEQVDDREREAPTPEKLEGLMAVARDMHDVAVAAQQGRDGMAAVQVSIH